MGIQIALIVVGVLLAAGLAVLIYRTMRTYDGSEHHTYVTQKEGKDTKAILAPTTLWNPQIKVLRKADAPDLSYMTQRPASDEYVEESLVERPSGQISLRIHTCTPRPFPAMTFDRHRVMVKATVTFQIDAERIDVVCQLHNFGSALAARVENLFDNEIGKYRDEELRANQTKIEEAVTQAMQAMEMQTDERTMMGIPFGIMVYEASFAYDEVPPEALDPVSMEAPASAGGGPGVPRGVMWMNDQQLDRIADVFKERDPVATASLMRMMELQTRQNIVQLLCQSGGMVGFTAKELGLSNSLQMNDPEPAPVARVTHAEIETAPDPDAIDVLPEPTNGTRSRSASVTAAPASAENVEAS
ncbi:MAG: hypothetical protein AAFN74_24305 [Myxococcota bacterium]